VVKLSSNKNNNNNNNSNTIMHRRIVIVLSSRARSHMQQFTLGPLTDSGSAPGGRQLVGQAANLTFESACRLL